MHNNCNALECSENHPPHFVEKLSSMKPVLGTKKLGDSCPRPLFLGGNGESFNVDFCPLLPFSGLLIAMCSNHPGPS